MRPIDADALINDIDGDLLDSIAEARAIEKIENAPTIGGWISVKDGMPEEEGIYLVVKQSPKREVTLAWFSGNENGWLSLDGSFYADGIITYYIPLPEPPKEET